MAVQKIKVAYIDSSGSSSGQVVSSNGTSVFWSEAAAGVNAAATFNWTNNHTFNANLTIASTGELIVTAGAGIYANGALGTAGQVLTSNASSVYWAAAVNTASAFTWTGNHIFNANLTIGSTGELIVTAGAGIYANGSVGTSGQYLTSNGSSIYWATASGGGATLSDETASATTHYPAMSTTTSGSWSAAKVSTTKLYFTPSTGQLNATIFNSLSDKRVKKNIKTINDALSTVVGMRGVNFDWKETSTPSIGLIAQEVEKLLPELVHTGNNGEKSVNYGGVVGVLVEAIKELTTRIEKLEGK
jgi:prefoldin subunit 5